MYLQRLGLISPRCPCRACAEALMEAYERVTDGGVGFHPKRALITYVDEFSYRASQTIYVREGSVVTRRLP